MNASARHGELPNFVSDENNKRTESYHKDTQMEHRFVRMNIALSHLEEFSSDGIDYPTVFIFGLPRSGTTLSHQLIAQCLDLGYINNLIARFWLAPQYGIALSKTVLGLQKNPQFNSNLGQTSGPFGPHEFGYFWNTWLKVKDINDWMAFDNPRPEIDWPELGRAVRGMQGMFGTGIVFKTMYAPVHIREFAKTFSMPLFIYVERDPVDVALSILAARIAVYGRPDLWWSVYTPNYYALAELPFHQQIAGQVYSLRETYEKQIGLIPSELSMRLHYSRLCEAPSDVIDDIRTRVAEVYGVDIGLRFSPPERFEFRARPDVLDEDQKAVVSEALNYR